MSFPHDDRLELLAGEGVSLLTCFQALPDLAFSLSRLGVAPALHVAHVEGGSDEHKKQKWHRMVLHGDASSEIATGVWDRIKVKADDARVELRRWDGSSGGVVQWSSKLDETDPSITYPTAIQRTAERFSFCANIGSLNEFGLYYVALYILGNYARYYPDQWMMEVETASPLALMASELLSGAERRLPLMTLMELDRIFYLERD